MGYVDNQWFVKSSFSNRTEGVTYNDITVQRNAENYNSIRNLLDTIVDASELNWYIVHIPNGEWFECDLNGKQYVILSGESKDGTVIYCDGTSIKLTPSNYSFAGEENKQLNLVSNTKKHVAMITSDFNAENITFTGKSIKYPIHADSAFDYNVTLFNCIITVIGISSMALVGVGIWGVSLGQNLVFNRCNFRRNTPGGYAVFIHNWNNQNHESTVSFKDCTFESCGFIFMQELGSNHNDLISIDNCISDYDFNVFWGADPTYWTNELGQHVEFQSELPYCMKLNYTNSNVSEINPYNPWSPEIIARPDYELYVNL